MYILGYAMRMDFISAQQRLRIPLRYKLYRLAYYLKGMRRGDLC